MMTSDEFGVKYKTAYENLGCLFLLAIGLFVVAALLYNGALALVATFVLAMWLLGIYTMHRARKKEVKE